MGMVIQIEQARKLLAEAERELGDAEQRVQELKVLAGFLRRQIDANAQATAVLPLPTDLPELPDYAEMSIPDSMKDALQRHGRPMHVARIAEALIAGGREAANHLKVSITSAARRRSDLFVQTAKATFGLRNGLPTGHRQGESQ